MAITLLDASLIIDAIRSPDPALLMHTLTLGGVCGMTRAEVFSGARTAADQLQFSTVLNGYLQVDVESEAWDEAGLLHSLLRRKGLTVPLTDALLASLALRMNVELWAHDKLFPAIQKLVPNLRLYAEPSP